MKKTTKVISMVLAIMMIISLLPMAVLAEEASPPDSASGKVIAVVYGNDMRAAIDTMEPGQKLYDPYNYIITSGDNGSLGVLKYLSDTVPSVAFTLTDEAGNTFSMTEKTGAKLADFVTDSATEDSQSSNINKTNSSAYRIYEAEVPVGNYSLKVDMEEPYGLSNMDLVTSEVEVVEDETVLAGEPKTASGYSTVRSGGSLWKPTYKNIDHTLTFTGYWLRKEDIGFTFASRDLAGNPVADATFFLVNRDEVIDILKFMNGLGLETFTTVLKNLQDEEIFNFEEVVELHKNLLKADAEGNVALDFETVFKLFQTYMALANDVDIWGKIKESGIHLPAIHRAVSQPDGSVTFSESSNATLDLGFIALERLNTKLKESDAELPLNEELQGILNIMLKVYEYKDQVDTLGSLAAPLINTVLKLLGTEIQVDAKDPIYSVAMQLGLVGPRMPSGNYIMFQAEAADGYLRNPTVYTMNVAWKTPEWLYVTVADIGIITPYFAKGLYDFTRESSVVSTLDKIIDASTIGSLTVNGKRVGILDVILNDKDNVSATVIGFASNIAYKMFGGDKLFPTQKALLLDLTDYLIKRGRTQQNLLIYMYDVAKKSKAFITGVVDENWTYYNLDKNPVDSGLKVSISAITGIQKALEEANYNYADFGKNTKELLEKAYGKYSGKTSQAVSDDSEDITDKPVTTKPTSKASAIQSIFSKVISNTKSLLSKLFRWK